MERFIKENILKEGCLLEEGTYWNRIITVMAFHLSPSFVGPGLPQREASHWLAGGMISHQWIPRSFGKENGVEPHIASP